MSEEKLYAIRNNVGKYLTIERTAPWWDSQVGTAVRSTAVALAWAGKHGGHVVTLVEEPKKVVLNREQAKIVDAAHDDKFPACYISGKSDDEELLMNAYVNGYTIKKEKRYKAFAPKSWWNNGDVPECMHHNYDGISVYKDDDDGTLFTQEQLAHYGLNGDLFKKEEVTDDDEQVKY